MLDTYKETFRTMVKDEMAEHIKLYHQKEKWNELRQRHRQFS
jgi:hypothetical protein